MSALTAACFLVLLSIGTVSAGNFGAGNTAPSYSCLNVGDNSYWNSECITDTYNWNVYIDDPNDKIPAPFETAFRNSVTDDYNSINGFAGTNQTSMNSETDVKIIESEMPGVYQYAIMSTCAAGATEGGGSGDYRWCKKALIIFDDDHPDTNHVLNNKAWYACHELGHTTGLAHYTGESTHQTCMDYGDNNVTNLSAHDIEHLVDCYPIPSSWPLYLTAGCQVEGTH